MPASKKDRRKKDRERTDRRAKDGPKNRRSWLSRVGTWLGIAGVLGVAAGGVLVARDARQRRAYTPEQVRQRLHERAARSAGRH